MLKYSWKNVHTDLLILTINTAYIVIYMDFFSLFFFFILLNKKCYKYWNLYRIM